MTTSLSTRSTGLGLEARERLAPAGGDQHVAALLREQVAQRLADAEVVVDDQDAHAGERGIARVGAGAACAPAARSAARSVICGAGRYSRVAYSVPCASVVRAALTMRWIRATAAWIESKRSLSTMKSSSRADACDVLLEQVQVVDDDLERVVDLVRQADRDLAERGQPVVPADLAQVLGEADRAQLLARRRRG